MKGGGLTVVLVYVDAVPVTDTVDFGIERQLQALEIADDANAATKAGRAPRGWIPGPITSLL